MNFLLGAGYTVLSQIKEPINSWDFYILVGETINKVSVCVLFKKVLNFKKEK